VTELLSIKGIAMKAWDRHPASFIDRAGVIFRHGKETVY